ncbi:PREDICTED: cytotoxic T-lymphocyte protein 4 [Thamnophis sirtalis]|uniref:Cytotoxic T-lymphocyte protein 4 n=1 Tax=Thamnophis sirtalis TaxID=35019 RepID=A0A6I9YEF6_9SAUR|nr:PREDICTED: cytotoxic T-lymphocyte protein 4 [Thamnophis sirtalis]
MEVTQPAFMMVKISEAAHFECEIKNLGNAEDLTVTLFKEDNGSIEICASAFTRDGIILGHQKENHRCQVYPGHDWVNVTVLGLQSSDAGLYICQIERISPPPYYPVKGKGTQLFVIVSHREGKFHSELSKLMIVAEKSHDEL